MSVNLICPQCGFENKSVGVFCTKCGAKMVNPEMKKQRRSFGAGFKLFYTLVRTLIGVALLAAIGLLLWPLKVPDNYTDPRRAETFNGKMENLSQAIDQQRAMAETIYQENLNDYLAMRRQGTPGTSNTGGLQMSLDYIGIDFGAGQFRALAAGGKGPITITYEIIGVPEVVDGKFRVRILRARVGHLPLPGVASAWAAGRIEHALSGLTRERKVLENANLVEVVQGKARIVVR